MAPREDSGRHRIVREEDRYRRLNERLAVLERNQKQLLSLIQVSQHALLGLKAAIWLGRVIKWFLIVGASGVAIWAAWAKKA